MKREERANEGKEGEGEKIHERDAKKGSEGERKRVRGEKRVRKRTGIVRARN